MQPVRAALENLHNALDGAAPFDPDTAERDFTIAVDNRTAVVFAASLAVTMAREAPFAHLHMRPSGTLNLAELLDRGDLDLALGGLAAPAERFSDLRLFDNRFAALVRRGHPAAAARMITLEALAAFPHLVLSSTREATSFVDAELAQHRLTRRVMLYAPLLSAAAVLAQSDMAAILSERTAQAFAR